jgi:hypothetical protein
MLSRINHSLATSCALSVFRFSLIDANVNPSWTPGVLSVRYPMELREYYPEPPRSQGHQSSLPRVHRKDCRSYASFRRVVSSNVGARAGNFPREGGTGLRHQNGRGRFPEEGWPDPSRPTSVRVGKGGETPFYRLFVMHGPLKTFPVRPFVKQNPTRRYCTCHHRALPTQSSRQSRTRLA